MDTLMLASPETKQGKFSPLSYIFKSQKIAFVDYEDNEKGTYATNSCQGYRFYGA